MTDEHSPRIPAETYSFPVVILGLEFAGTYGARALTAELCDAAAESGRFVRSCKGGIAAECLYVLGGGGQCLEVQKESAPRGERIGRKLRAEGLAGGSRFAEEPTRFGKSRESRGSAPPAPGAIRGGPSLPRNA